MSDPLCYSADIMKNEKISIQVDGVIVRGRARIEPCEFSVQITDPFHWLQSEIHIRGMARMARPFEGEKGVAGVKTELERLYRLGCFLKENMEPLQAAYDNARADVRKTARKLRLTDYSDDKAELHSRLKAGEIDNDEYQQLLVKLQERKEIFSREFRRIDAEFFEKLFPAGLPQGNHQRILQILDNPSLLFFGTSSAPRSGVKS